MFALLIAAVVVVTTLRAVAGSHKELLWPKNLAATLAVNKAGDKDCCSESQYRSDPVTYRAMCYLRYLRIFSASNLLSRS